MIGLPGESDDDVLGIARMAERAQSLGRELGRGRARVAVSVSSYIPKPHTPFESESFAGAETLRRRQQLVRAAAPRGVKVAFHDIEASLVEATLARAGEGSDRLVEDAWRRGARFDGWSEHFTFAAWNDAAEALGLELGEPAFLNIEEPDWRRAVDALLTPEFFSEELEHSRDAVLTPDCRDGRCSVCGVCGDGIAMEVLA